MRWPSAGRLDEPRLVLHELEAARREPVDRGRLGQLHGGRLAARADLERLEQRPEQLPVRESPYRHDGGGRLREVGGEERVRELSRAHRCRDHLVLGELGLGLGLARDDELVGAELRAGLEEPVAAEPLRDRGDRGIGLEEGDEARVARRGLREDLRDAVEALEQLGTGGVGDLGVGLHPGALLAHEQRDDLELRAVRGAELALLRLGLDLAHLAREDRDDGCVVVARSRTLPLPRLGHGPPALGPSPARPLVTGGGGRDRSGRSRMPPHAVRRIPNRAAREPGSRGRPKNGFVGRPAILAGCRRPRRRATRAVRRVGPAGTGRRRMPVRPAESAYASAMDDLAGADAISPDDDDEFTVVAGHRVRRGRLAADDDHRPLDDSLADEVAGIDAERRVDLARRAIRRRRRADRLPRWRDRAQTPPPPPPPPPPPDDPPPPEPLDDELELDPDHDELDADENDDTATENAAALKPSRPAYQPGRLAARLVERRRARGPTRARGRTARRTAAAAR